VEVVLKLPHHRWHPKSLVLYGGYCAKQVVKLSDLSIQFPPCLGVWESMNFVLRSIYKAWAFNWARMTPHRTHTHPCVIVGSAVIHVSTHLDQVLHSCSQDLHKLLDNKDYQIIYGNYLNILIEPNLERQLFKSHENFTMMTSIYSTNLLLSLN